MKRGVLALGLMLGSVSGAWATSPPVLPEGTIQLPGGMGAWVTGPATLPPGTQMMILEGHPKKEGMFTIRLKIPAGVRIAPHWHPREERVTILSGQARVAFGDTFDETFGTAFPAGSFYVNPPKSHHFVWTVEPTVMQITGQGPWELHYLGEKK